jgi:hypothetical protein
MPSEHTQYLTNLYNFLCQVAGHPCIFVSLHCASVLRSKKQGTESAGSESYFMSSKNKLEIIEKVAQRWPILIEKSPDCCMQIDA